MLYNGDKAPSLVSEEYNQMCVDNHVEATVQAFPNPGSPFKAMRLVTFRNFNETTIRVIQFDRDGKTHDIPGKGTVQVMLMPDEPLPIFEKVE